MVQLIVYIVYLDCLTFLFGFRIFYISILSFILHYLAFHLSLAAWFVSCMWFQCYRANLVCRCCYPRWR